jgi:hypothetical protein
MITSILIILSGWAVYRNRRKVKAKAEELSSKPLRTRKYCWLPF